MLTAIAAIAFLSPPQQDQTGAQLVSKMLKYYSDANTLTGTIKLTAFSGGGQAAMETYVQYEKPAKLFIRQVKPGGEPQQWVIVSDGQRFGYDTPNDFPGARQRLYEKVNQGKGNVYDYKRIYALAAADSLGDRSLPLDFLISRREDLEHDILSFVTVNYNGKVAVGNEQLNSITGDWRPYGRAAVQGKYTMFLADDGHLIRYVLDETIAVPNAAPQQVRFVWVVDAKVDGTPDPSLFKVQ